MPKYEIHSKVKNYTGVSAGVSIANGVGYTNNYHAAEMLKEFGYDVVELKPEKPADPTTDPESGETKPDLTVGSAGGSDKDPGKKK